MSFLRILCVSAILAAGHLLGSPAPILVTLPPQLEALQALTAGERPVISVVPPGAIPENYELTPRQMATFSKACIFLTIGAPFEIKLAGKLRAALPSLKVVDGTSGMRFREMTEPHSHGGHSHHSEGRDPHVWLSVENMMRFTENAAETLSREEPSRRSIYQERKQAYLQRLSDLRQELDAAFSGMKGRHLLVNHPAFGYLADEYGMHQLAVEKEGKTPGAHHLAEISGKISSEGHRALFVQPQFNRQTCRLLADKHHLRIVVLDPLPSHYIDGMRAIAKTITNELQSNK